MQRKTSKEIKKEERLIRVSQQDRSRNRHGNKVKNTRGNRRKRRKNTTVINLFGAHNTISDKSNLKVGSSLRSELFHHGSVVDIIRDIYPVIKDDINSSFHFSEDTEPIDFLTWIVKEYNKVCEAEEWDIEYIKGKFCITSIYEIDDIKVKGYCPELDFMPILYGMNKDLHNLFIDLFSILRKHSSAEFYFNNDEVEASIEYIEEGIEEDDENRELLQRYINDYKVGDAKMLELHIESSTATVTSINKELKRFKPKGFVEKLAIKCIKNALELIKYKESFYSYIQTTREETREGYPVTPIDYAMFDWNFDNHNPIALNKAQRMDSSWGEYGEVGFRYVDIDNKKEKPSRFIYDYIKVLCDVSDVSEIIKDLESP